MPVYTINNVYSVSDFNGLTDLQSGTFTLNALSTPDIITVLDDDDVLEDTVTAGDQTLDSSQQVLDAAYDGIPSGANVQARATAEITVQEPDGTTYTLEMNQLIIGGVKYYSFQYDVPPGSQFTIPTGGWQSTGNTEYVDLAGGDPIIENEYNQIISDSLAQSIISGGATVNTSDLSSMFVNDQDAILEDNNDSSSGDQTVDQNVQNLSQAFGSHPAGAYVLSRLSYTVQNTVTGETAEMYQLQVDNEWNGLTLPGGDGVYWAFSNDFKITDGSNIEVVSGPTASGLVAHTDLFVCFTKGMRIKTDRGDVAIENLETGDHVLTADSGYQPIMWIGSAWISSSGLTKNPNLRPIRIQANSLGHGLPERDLVVSPQHRILVRSKIARRMFGQDEILVAAKHLLEIDGIDIAYDFDDVTYYHFLLDRHHIVYSNGTPSESLFTGPEALKSVGEKSRQEILTLFPELCNIDYRALPACKLLRGREGRKLAERHKKNRKPLIQSLS